MRRRWRVLVAIGVSGLAAGLGFFISERSDEYAVLRPFDPVDQRYEVTMGSAIGIGTDGKFHPAGCGIWCREFRFPKVTPALIATLKKYSEFGYYNGQMDVKMPNGREGHFEASDATMVFFDEPQPSWFDLKVDALKRAFHMRPGWVPALEQ